MKKHKLMKLTLFLLKELEYARADMVGPTTKYTDLAIAKAEKKLKIGVNNAKGKRSSKG